MVEAAAWYVAISPPFALAFNLHTCDQNLQVVWIALDQDADMVNSESIFIDGLKTG